MSDLKPCPFCGAGDQRVSQEGIFCVRCGVQVLGARNESDAAAWNRRAEPKAPDAAEVADLLREFVRADDDAKVNPVGGLTIGGLADARDNTGCIYQSQQLADALTKARAMIQAAEQEGRA